MGRTGQGGKNGGRVKAVLALKGSTAVDDAAADAAAEMDAQSGVRSNEPTPPPTSSQQVAQSQEEPVNQGEAGPPAELYKRRAEKAKAEKEKAESELAILKRKLDEMERSGAADGTPVSTLEYLLCLAIDGE